MVESIRYVLSASTCRLLLGRRGGCSRVRRRARTAKTAAGARLALAATRLAVALLLIAGILTAPRFAAAEDAPVAFIRTLGNQAVSVIQSNYGLDAKAAYFNRMIREDFDLSGMARFVLGPHWQRRARMSGGSFAGCW